MVENKFKINSISIDTTAKCFCPLGNDWYTNQFAVNFVPGEMIPDYCHVDKWIDENINGKAMIIEEAVAMLYEHLRDTYKPDSLNVTSYVEDARHCAVTVSKGY